MSPWRKRLIWFLLPVSVVLMDQATKGLVRDNLARGEEVEVIDGLFRFNHIQNKGAAFGLFAEMPDGQRELLLTSLGALALLLVVVYSLKLPPGEWLAQLGLHLIFAGAIGNLIDRFTIGWVTDFLEFYWQDLHWPAFNIADSAIVLGVLVLLVDTLRPRRKREEAASAGEGAEDAVAGGVETGVGVTEKPADPEGRTSGEDGSDVS